MIKIKELLDEKNRSGVTWGTPARPWIIKTKESPEHSSAKLDKLHDILAKESSKHLAGMDHSVEGALARYKEDSEHINAFHRDGWMQDSAQDWTEDHYNHYNHTRLLDHAVSMKTNHKFTVYRGLGDIAPNEMGLHETHEDPGYTSTSLSPLTARYFAHKFGRDKLHHIARIKINPGTKGFYLDHDWTKGPWDPSGPKARIENKGEREFLLQRGTHFKVTGHHTDKILGHHYTDLEIHHQPDIHLLDLNPKM